MMSARPCVTNPYLICLPAVCRRRLLRLKRYRCLFRRQRLKKIRNHLKKDKKEWTLPIVCGAVHEGEVHLVILKWQGQMATCAAGEWWNGWYVAYVNRQATGLQRDGRVFEIPL